MLIQNQYNKLILLEIWIEQKFQQCFFITEEAKGTALDFSKGTAKVL